VVGLPIDRPEFSDLVCFNFYLGWRHIQSIYRSTFPTGVSPQRTYLLCACDPSSPTPVAQLVAALELDSPAMSGLLARLEGEGLLDRRVNPADRREVLIHLTPAGVRLREEAVQALTAADRDLRALVDPEDLTRLRRIVTQLGDLA
jgi:MarR family transcriptional regulator, organic hydroperoxide resistance regulator